MSGSNERPSLTNLRRSLPPARPVQPVPELEERLLDPQQVREAKQELKPESAIISTVAVQPVEVQQKAIPSTQTRLRIKPGRQKPLTRAVTYKLPVPLLDRLAQIADYNNVSMTEIVSEALERHLPNFPQPPEAQ